MTKRILVGVGANLGDRARNIEKAITLVEEKIGTVIKRSKIIETKPYLPEGVTEIQPYYLNGAIEIASKLEPHQVLTHLLAIEAELGRIRTNKTKWSARTIDLDLLGVGDVVLNTSVITLPHPDMHLRDFVLIPLNEIAPDWIHPVFNKNVATLLKEL